LTFRIAESGGRAEAVGFEDGTKPSKGIEGAGPTGVGGRNDGDRVNGDGGSDKPTAKSPEMIFEEVAGYASLSCFHVLGN